jgi:hypothetical protein
MPAYAQVSSLLAWVDDSWLLVAGNLILTVGSILESSQNTNIIKSTTVSKFTF